MARTPDTRPGTPESSTEKAIRMLVVDAITRLMARSNMHHEGIYDWGAIQAEVESSIAPPGRG